MSSIKKYSSQYQDDQDNYSTLIVEDLLQGTNEWRGVDEIIKITFKALTDIVKQQGDAIIDLQNIVQQKVNKNELLQGLQLKASLQDVSRTISEISNLLDSKISVGDINNIRKDFLLKSDLQFILNDRPSHQEIQALLNNNKDPLYERIEEIQNEFIKNATNCVTQKEFEAILTQLEMKANIEEVNEALEQKANKQSIQTALHRKANKAQVDGLIARKADITDLQNIVDILEQKVDSQVLEKITNILDGKVDKHEQSYFLNCLQNDKDEILNLKERIEEITSILDQKITDERSNSEQLYDLQKNIQKNRGECDQDELKAVTLELYKLKEDILGMKQLMDDNLHNNSNSMHEQFDCIQKEIQIISKRLNQKHSDVEAQVEENLQNYQKNIKNKFYKEFEQIHEQYEILKASTEELRQKKLDKKEHQDHKTKILLEVGQKLDNSELQSAQNLFQNEINRKIIDIRDEFKNSLRQIELEINSNLKQKASKEELSEVLGGKSDRGELHQLQQMLLEVQQHQKATHQKLAEDSSQIRNCITFNEFNDHILNSKKLIDLMQRDLQLKANITDVCTIFDSKASIQSVNETLEEIHKDLDSKCSQSDLLHIQKDQGIINENFCFENMIGRWRWRSSELQQGNLIPWDLQIVNTIPNNYLWEKDSPNLIIVEQGIYQFSLGVFARKKVQIKILLNGENILSSSEGANQENLNPNTKKYKTFGSHKDGYITGVSLNDFINIPAKSKITIQYKGELYGDEEGLMILKKL